MVAAGVFVTARDLWGVLASVPVARDWTDLIRTGYFAVGSFIGTGMTHHALATHAELELDHSEAVPLHPSPHAAQLHPPPDSRGNR